MNSSIDLPLALCAGLHCQIFLMTSHGPRAKNFWIPPICLNLIYILSQAAMLRLLDFRFPLLLRVALKAAAMVLLELICKSPGKVMDPICCVGDKRP